MLLLELWRYWRYWI